MWGAGLKKHIFIINGSGGVGKDTLCDLAAQRWRTQNVSSITPVLAVARAAGWNGEKTPAARRFLSDLKAACTQFNDLPFTYCMEQCRAFLQSENEIFFVHIREKEEIARFCEAAGAGCKTILVKRPSHEQARGALGNRSDDEVAAYPYDYTFENDCSLQELPQKAVSFFQNILENKLETGNKIPF